MKKISVILVSYNTCQLTLQTIQSVYEKTKGISFEIILVDNNSIDNTVDQVESLFPDVICIRNNENKGFGFANNKGAEIATGDYIFLLNTDTLLISNALKILSDYLDEPKNKDVVAVCGNLFNEKNEPATSFLKFFPGIVLEINELLFNALHHFKSFNHYFNFSLKPIKFRGSISGADAMIRKKEFDEIGGFDKDYFLYYEETDLFYRFIKNGFLVASVPDAEIVHLEGASETKKELTLERSFVSKYIFLKKHKSYIYTNVVHSLYVLTCISRVFIFSILKKKEKIEYWKLLRKIEKNTFKKMRNKYEKK
ncbi:glycosyltransferase family 2 protein [Pectobacterium brasiliense]|uniref:glycosyltransferase family 2 protein n=1 Tax=Pectobacterium brasiliense TaxID=180957 RepID=UPI001B39AF58|nr:glycosyltransferase family 2 protein [Pectobacterium brasiliense]MBQ4794602.1 glycosyltransferase [Pectobacterium versatile]MCA5918292.1 glycosyltransferase family 2 protein [Pectobacterium brasiliense]MCA5926169.1 glycosyltransferase family 2 protein [Pectobacterium brasiliense]MCA5934156.1 glycosyltransferase family 2 protein [Pectobacterium brasiliense]MCA5938338.1 glycosyltransferase family 2 protein [Pectobacterium brasiliense]